MGQVLTPKTHCKYRHEFTEENTYRPPSRPNSRMCRTCMRERAARQPYVYTPAPPAEPRSCVECGTVFTPKRRNGDRSRFCSKRCANKSWRDRHPSPVSEERGVSDRVVLTADDVREMIQLYDSDPSISTRMLAERFGVRKPHISAILNGRSWVSVTGGVRRSRQTVVPDSIIRNHISAEVDAMVTRMSSELEISESEVRNYLRRVLRPKPNERKES